MKKILVIVLVILATVGLSSISLAYHVFDTTIGFASVGIYTTGASGQFIELDETSGYIWMAVGGTQVPDRIYVISTTGVEAPFSPISTGLSSLGVVTGFYQTSGIAIDRSTTPHIAYVVSDIGTATPMVSKFVAGTGAPINGIDTASGIPTALGRMGDIQFDSAGRLFTTHKVGNTVWALNKNTGASLSINTGTLAGIPIFTGGIGAVRRGVGVTPNGNTVYVANESDDVVYKISGNASLLDGTQQVTYDISTLVDYNDVNANPGACEVDASGNIYISVTGASSGDTSYQDKVEIYNSSESIQEVLTITSPYGQNILAIDSADFNPRGVAFSSSDVIGNDLWIARFFTINWDNPVGTGGQSGPVIKFNGIIPAASVESKYWFNYDF